MLRISQTSSELKAFIAAAEMAWFNVYDSANDNRVIIVDGTEYKQLPLRFSTRAKVIAYFRRYWGIAMSNRMFCNLFTVTRNNRLYVIVGDTGVIPSIPRRIRVTSRTATRIRVTAILSIDETTDEEIERVRYLIAKSGERLSILNRDKKNTDPRYLPCR
ncbi:DL-endopeptidase inhibitor IseA family protein [Paenibacillus sp. IHBB 3054]|uniref:DL-endopeptidase inhibitor IseA family protein n=1 Tax=Paenibacillus sp. IHBB 3054 TaxID=3425689 RepID=UPI003F678203